MKPPAKLKEGILITCLEDIIIPGTGVTFYIWKGKKYRIKEYLPEWTENAWHIQLEEIINSNKKRKNFNYLFENQGWLTEDELFKKFNCLQYLRKEKLMKLNEYN